MEQGPIEAIIGDGNGAKRVYLVEVSDKYDKTNRRFLIHVNANAPSVAHKLAMRAGYGLPKVKGISRETEATKATKAPEDEL